MTSSTSIAPAFLDAEIEGLKLKVRLAAVCRVGRNPGNDLVLEVESVSRNHALVYSSEPGVYYINDLGSSNGTTVNGLRVSSPTLLKDGDKISFGSCPAQFRQQEAPPPAPIRPNAHDTQTNVLFLQRLITVLVVDIRGFTGLSQRLDPGMIAKITGALFRQGGGVLRDRGAWGQKYIGDAIMAVWIHAGSTTTEMTNVLTALASLARIAAGLQAQFGLEHPIRIGAGLNSGMASFGNVGSGAVPDYTALGDVVNCAFRLESATKEVGWDLLLGTRTYELIGSLGDVRSLLRDKAVQLKGYAEPVPAWGGRFQDLLPRLEAICPDASAVKGVPVKTLEDGAP
jgi:adenylate cyclase